MKARHLFTPEGLAPSHAVRLRGLAVRPHPLVVGSLHPEVFNRRSHVQMSVSGPALAVTPWSVVGYRQTSNLIPLAYGLVPAGHEQAVYANLVADIHARGDHLNTGAI